MPVPITLGDGDLLLMLALDPARAARVKAAAAFRPDNEWADLKPTGYVELPPEKLIGPKPPVDLTPWCRQWRKAADGFGRGLSASAGFDKPLDSLSPRVVGDDKPAPTGADAGLGKPPMDPHSGRLLGWVDRLNKNNFSATEEEMSKYHEPYLLNGPVPVRRNLFVQDEHGTHVFPHSVANNRIFEPAPGTDPDDVHYSGFIDLARSKQRYWLEDRLKDFARGRGAGPPGDLKANEDYGVSEIKDPPAKDLGGMGKPVSEGKDAPYRGDIASGKAQNRYGLTLPADVTAPKPGPVIAGQPSWLSENKLPLLAGGAGLLGVLGGALYARHRRKNREKEMGKEAAEDPIVSIGKGPFGGPPGPLPGAKTDPIPADEAGMFHGVDMTIPMPMEPRNFGQRVQDFVAAAKPDIPLTGSVELPPGVKFLGENKPTAAPAPTPSWMERNSLPLMAGGAGLLGVLGGALYARHRRKKQVQEMDQAMDKEAADPSDYALGGTIGAGGLAMLLGAGFPSTGKKVMSALGRTARGTAGAAKSLVNTPAKAVTAGGIGALGTGLGLGVRHRINNPAPVPEAPAPAAEPDAGDNLMGMAAKDRADRLGISGLIPKGGEPGFGQRVMNFVADTKADAQPEQPSFLDRYGLPLGIGALGLGGLGAYHLYQRHQDKKKKQQEEEDDWGDKSAAAWGKRANDDASPARTYTLTPVNRPDQNIVSRIAMGMPAVIPLLAGLGAASAPAGFGVQRAARGAGYGVGGVLGGVLGRQAATEMGAEPGSAGRMAGILGGVGLGALGSRVLMGPDPAAVAEVEGELKRKKELGRLQAELDRAKFAYVKRADFGERLTALSPRLGGAYNSVVTAPSRLAKSFGDEAGAQAMAHVNKATGGLFGPTDPNAPPGAGPNWGRWALIGGLGGAGLGLLGQMGRKKKNRNALGGALTGGLLGALGGGLLGGAFGQNPTGGDGKAQRVEAATPPAGSPLVNARGGAAPFTVPGATDEMNKGRNETLAAQQQGKFMTGPTQQMLTKLSPNLQDEFHKQYNQYMKADQVARDSAGTPIGPFGRDSTLARLTRGVFKMDNPGAGSVDAANKGVTDTKTQFMNAIKNNPELGANPEVQAWLQNFAQQPIVPVTDNMYHEGVMGRSHLEGAALSGGARAIAGNVPGLNQRLGMGATGVQQQALNLERQLEGKATPPRIRNLFGLSPLSGGPGLTPELAAADPKLVAQVTARLNSGTAPGAGFMDAAYVRKQLQLGAKMDPQVRAAVQDIGRSGGVGSLGLKTLATRPDVVKSLAGLSGVPEAEVQAYLSNPVRFRGAYPELERAIASKSGPLGAGEIGTAGRLGGMFGRPGAGELALPQGTSRLRMTAGRANPLALTNLSRGLAASQLLRALPAHPEELTPTEYWFNYHQPWSK